MEVHLSLKVGATSRIDFKVEQGDTMWSVQLCSDRIQVILSGLILEVKVTGTHDQLYIGVDKVRDIFKVLSLSNWVDGDAIWWDGKHRRVYSS